MMVDESRKKYFVNNLVQWEKENFRPFQWRTETTPYRVFISEVLLKRTTSTAADLVFKKFIKKYPDLSSLNDAEVSDIEDILRPIGLYYQRSKGIKEAVEFIINNYGAEFPTKLNELLNVPHIGPYTAGAIVSIGMGYPATMIDSNAVRVLTRVFKDILPTNPTIKKITELANELLPEDDFIFFNWGLIDLGSLVCTYRACCNEKCPVKSTCHTFTERESTV